MTTDMFTFVSGLFLVYAVFSEIMYYRNAKAESDFLLSFDDFLSHVRHFYYHCNSIADAVFYSIPACKQNMKADAEGIFEILEAEIYENESGKYTAERHKYVKLFISLALPVIENGDSQDAGGSVFLNSVMQLRSDIQDERRFLDEKRHRFSGLTLTAALPIAAVPYIAAWGSETIPSLLGFYYGRTGNILKLILLAVTFVCFRAVSYLREGKKKPVMKSIMRRINLRLSEPLRDMLGRITHRTGNIRTKKRLLFVASVIVMIFVLNSGHTQARELLCTDISDIGSLSDTADGKQIKAMERVIPLYVRAYTAEHDMPDPEIMSLKLMDEPGIRTEDVAVSTANEIVRRVAAYNAEYFGGFDILLTFIAALAAYFYPEIVSMFRKTMSESRMQDEVMQFQSLIHMQKNVPGISPIALLESLESFADVFGPALRQCINEFSVNDIGALENMAIAENYPGFVKIAECFLSVDEAGVSDAFDEISAEIVNFKENRKLDRSILLDNEVMLASLISVIPGGAVLFGYLLIPFMLRSLSMFDSYQETLKTYIGNS